MQEIQNYSIYCLYYSFEFGIVFGLKISQATSKIGTNETKLYWTDGNEEAAAADMRSVKYI